MKFAHVFTIACLAMFVTMDTVHASGEAEDSGCGDGIDTWVTKVWTGSIIGMIIGVTWIVISSMIVCCGKMTVHRKKLGGAAIGFGVLALIIPAISATVATNSVIDECNLDDSTADALRAIGAFYAYTFAGGWLSAITGIVALSLGAGACCGCCKAKGATVVVVAGAQPVIQAQPVVQVAQVSNP